MPNRSSKNAKSSNAKFLRGKVVRKIKDPTMKMRSRRNSYGNRNSGSRAYASRHPGRVFRIWFVKPKLPHAAFVAPFMHKLNDDEEFGEQCKIDHICFRRQGLDTDEPMPANDTTNKLYFPQFVHVLTEDEDDSAEGLRKWALHVVSTLNTMSQDPDVFQYPEHFHFVGDNTPPTPHPIGNYVLDADLTELLEVAFPAMNLREIADDPEILEAFVGPDRMDHAKALIDGHLNNANNDPNHEFRFIAPEDF